MINDAVMFPASPTLRFFDPLGELLGAGDGHYVYRFDDAVKLAGHACPTVAGAFLLVKCAMERLYGQETPRRGGVRVTVDGGIAAGVNGPMSQVFSLLTGAAAENGFHGLGGHHVRQGLLRFNEEAPPGRYTFERLDNGSRVVLGYDPSAIAPDPLIATDLSALLKGESDRERRQRFSAAWRDRVARILADGGQQTVKHLE